MNRILYKYLLNEIWPTFLAGLFVAVFIVIATKMLSITEMVISKGIPVTDVVWIMTYLMPDIVVFSLPAVILTSVVIAFLRLSSDSEIIAMKSSGISLYQLLPPVAAGSFVVFLAAMMISIQGVPWGNSSFKNMVYQVARTNAGLEIKERIFCSPFQKVVFFVERFNPEDRTMSGVFVADMRDEKITNTIVAEKGRIYFLPDEQGFMLRFNKGSIFVDDEQSDAVRTLKFDTYDLNIPVRDFMESLSVRGKKPDEMSVSELTEQLHLLDRNSNKYNKVMIELYEKWSIPAAVFLMGIIGIPMGAQIKNRGRSAGLGASLGVFLVYYLCLAGTRNICETGTISPVVGVWIPDVFLAISCIFLYRRVANEESIDFFRVMARKISKKFY